MIDQIHYNINEITIIFDYFTILWLFLMYDGEMLKLDEMYFKTTMTNYSSHVVIGLRHNEIQFEVATVQYRQQTILLLQCTMMI